MKKSDINVVHLNELEIFGLWGKSNDKRFLMILKTFQKNIIP